MKIFTKESGWSEKVNFVDENNVLVGYSMAQHCCEQADWFISDRIEKEIKDKKEFDLTNYKFDINFFVESSEGEYDELNIAIFRLINNKGSTLFLHLFNCHNGYYSHGFEFKNNNEIIKEGSL